MRMVGATFCGAYNPAMPPYTFSTHVGALCVTRDTNVHKLGEKLGIDPMELLRMINGKVVPTKQVIAGLSRELDSDESYLIKLANEIKP
jgi:transcriptional regulator with XRE-family HTH domain